MQFSVMNVKMMGVHNVLISVWDVREVKLYTQVTTQIYCLLTAHTCVGDSGVCVTAHWHSTCLPLHTRHRSNFDSILCHVARSISGVICVTVLALNMSTWHKSNLDSILRHMTRSISGGIC